jgi:hypothetical protein
MKKIRIPDRKRKGGNSRARINNAGSQRATFPSGRPANPG